jgi:hypothetical protein
MPYGWCANGNCQVYVQVDDHTCVGYDVYVDGTYILTEGASGTPDGYCAFYVSAGTHKFELRMNRYSTSKSWYCQCGNDYSWVSMPDYWCGDAYEHPPPVISAPQVAKPVLTYPLKITPEKDKYYVGDTIRAEFTVKNVGGASITLDKLLVGGRFNDGKLPNGEFPDFTHQSTTLPPNGRYTGTLTLTQPGNYHFFVAYYIENPTPEEKKLLDEYNWNTCVDLGDGLTDEDRIEDIEDVTVGQINTAPSNLIVRTRGEFAQTRWGIGVYHYLTWDYNFGTGKGFVIQEKFVPDPLIYANPKRINWPYPIGFSEVDRVGPHLRTYKIATPIPPINSAHTKEYRVAAILTDDCLSRWSNIARISPSTISPPSKLEATVSKAPLQVKLTWKDMSNNEISFYIYRWEGIGTGPWIESPDHEWPLLDTVDANVATFIDTDVRLGYTFKYIIKAFNGVDISLPSYMAKLYIPVPDEIPPLPTNNPSNIIFASIKSPVELRVYDSQGNVTGLLNGEVKEEIPYSLYVFV